MQEQRHPPTTRLKKAPDLLLAQTLNLSALHTIRGTLAYNGLSTSWLGEQVDQRDIYIHFNPDAKRYRAPSENLRFKLDSILQVPPDIAWYNAIPFKKASDLFLPQFLEGSGIPLALGVLGYNCKSQLWLSEKLEISPQNLNRCFRPWLKNYREPKTATRIEYFRLLGIPTDIPWNLSPASSQLGSKDSGVANG